MTRYASILIVLISITFISSGCCKKTDCFVQNTPHLNINFTGFESTDNSFVTIEDDKSNVLEQYHSVSGDGTLQINLDKIINNYYGENTPVFIIVKTVNREDIISQVQITQIQSTLNCKSCMFSTHTQEVTLYENWKFRFNGDLIQDTQEVTIDK